MEQANLTERAYEPVTQADPVGEIMRRLDLVTGLLAALAAVSDGDEGLNDTLQRVTEREEYFRRAAAFVRSYQQDLRAVFSDSPAGYSVKTLALNDAISAGGTGAQIFDDFKRRLAEYSKTPIKDKGTTDAGPATSAPIPLWPRLDLLDVISTPSSDAAQMVQDVISRAEIGLAKIRDLEKRQSTHSTEWEVRPKDGEEYGGKVLVIRKGKDGGEMRIGIKDPAKFEHRRSGISKKISRLILTKAGYLNGRDGAAPLEIAISAQEMVGLGLYNKGSDAREGISKAIESFVDNFGFFVLQSQGRGKDKRYMWAPFVIMAEWTESRDYLRVGLNPYVPWADVFREFTYYPTAYFKARSTEADLLEKIYTIARMKGDWLYQHAAFYVKLETVREWLHLPEISGCQYSKQYIKDPIYNAIKGINEAGGGEDLSLVSANSDEALNPDLPVKKWIQGRLRVDIRKTPAWGAFTAIFKENRGKAGAAARQKTAVDTALAIDEAREARKKARTDKKRAGQDALAAKYEATFGKGAKK